jgi:2-hydroxy-3-keto-5-methylthiopentenyl-1-phosphate phosphatase
MPYAMLCDFDGTVAPFDIGADFVRHFGRGSTAGLESALARWEAGEIGHRELTRVECERLVVTREQALDFVRRYSLDPAFPAFARDMTRLGRPVEVVSEGFDFYIADLLERAELRDVRWSSNRLRFDDAGGVEPEFPNAGGCGRCGNCKGERVREYQRRGFRVVLVGDGFSDRCGARAADHVLARGVLLEWCRTEGLAAAPFANFTDVAAWVSGLVEPAPVAPPAGEVA